MINLLNQSLISGKKQTLWRHISEKLITVYVTNYNMLHVWQNIEKEFEYQPRSSFHYTQFGGLIFQPYILFCFNLSYYSLILLLRLANHHFINHDYFLLSSSFLSFIFSVLLFLSVVTFLGVGKIVSYFVLFFSLKGLRIYKVYELSRASCCLLSVLFHLWFQSCFPMYYHCYSHERLK